MPVDTGPRDIKGVAEARRDGQWKGCASGGWGRTIAALADIAGTTNYIPVSPGCTSSEAPTERYDADVPPGMTTREIPGMEYFASIRKTTKFDFVREVFWSFCPYAMYYCTAVLCAIELHRDHFYFLLYPLLLRY